jgi:selenocysteine lyase/cysteine desulfurase
VDTVFRKEQDTAVRCVQGLWRLGIPVFAGAHQAGTVSFVPPVDCEEVAAMLGKKGIAVRAGLHCAPLAHESAGTLETGTVRVSFGHDADPKQAALLQRALKLYLQGK